jgi:hypothetical protein
MTSQNPCQYGPESSLTDIRNLTWLKKLDENAPEPMKAFWNFDKEAFQGCH